MVFTVATLPLLVTLSGAALGMSPFFFGSALAFGSVKLENYVYLKMKGEPLCIFSPFSFFPPATTLGKTFGGLKGEWGSCGVSGAGTVFLCCSFFSTRGELCLFKNGRQTAWMVDENYAGNWD